MAYSKNGIRKRKDKKNGPSIILTGFRATGKTAVGRELADLLGYDFLDTDEELCRESGAEVADLVARWGWTRFRQEEERLLHGLAGRRGLVVATGGGAILHRQAWDRLRQGGTVVWLQAARDTILERLQRDDRTESQRPSLTGRPVAAEVDEVLAERTPLYRAGSDFRVRVEGRDPRSLGRHIQKLLREAGQL